jgi:hypothetical protein
LLVSTKTATAAILETPDARSGQRFECRAGGF